MYAVIILSIHLIIAVEMAEQVILLAFSHQRSWYSSAQINIQKVQFATNIFLYL